MTISDIIIKNCNESDNAHFLKLLGENEEVEAFSYYQVVERACQWKEHYREKGLQRKDTIAIALPHSLDLYASFIGAIFGGYVPNMLSFPSFKFSQKEYFKTIHSQLENSQCRLLICETQLASLLVENFAKLPILTPDSIYLTGTIDSVPASSEDIAFLQYSSGTTGMKKGVAISHRALLWQIENYSQVINTSRDDTIVSWLPLYHDMGLITCFFLPLIKKIPLVTMLPFDWVKKPAIWMQAVSDHGATLSWLPNFSYNFMAKIKETDIAKINLTSLRGLINCSEPIMAESHDLFYQRYRQYGLKKSVFACSYAMAENTFAVTSGGFQKEITVEYIDHQLFQLKGVAMLSSPNKQTRRVVSSGEILPQTEIKIINAKKEVLPDRHIGEIVIKSSCLLSEYHNNIEATKNSLDDGWYYSGDLGYRVNDDLFVTGRKKDLIIINGVNIYPQDVEALINEVEGTVPGRNVVFSVQDSKQGTEYLVVLAESKSSDLQLHRSIQKGIHKQCINQLGLAPGVIRVMEHMSLKKSTSGKMSRSMNKENFLTQLQPTS